MVQKSNYAAAMGAPTMLRKEECAASTGQKSNYAAATDVQTKSSVVEYVGDTGRVAIHTTNLPHLDQNTMKLPQLKFYPISVLPELP